MVWELRTGHWIGLHGAVLMVACLVPGAAWTQTSGRNADVDLGGEVVRELFPEVQTQTRLNRDPEGPRVHLTAAVGFSKAVDRINLAFTGLRRFSGGAAVDDIHDRWKSGVISASVRARGGWLVGSFRVDRQGMGIEVDVYSAGTEADAAGSLPALSVIPESMMWLFPL